MVFQVPVTSTDPLVFYCTTGQHCTRGMYGVINGASDQTLKSYRSKITVNKDAVAPTTIGGGQMVANEMSNVLPAKTAVAAGSVTVSLASIFVSASLALLITQ